MKKIGVAIPTYNRNDLLEKLLLSIPDDIKISISDNGGYVTNEIKQKYGNAFYICHDKVIDIFHNWNSAIENDIDVDFLSIPSDDDLYLKEKFQIIVNAINSIDADVFVFGNQFIDGDDTLIGSYCPDKYEVLNAPYGFERFMHGVDVRMPSVFFKKSFLDEIGYFDAELFSLTAADSELIQRALLLGKAVFVPEVVSSYRVWPGSLTDQKIATSHWLIEIELWADKIVELGSNSKNLLKPNFNWNVYKDELFARNLLAGLENKYKNKKYLELRMHYKAHRFPKKALLRTKLRIIKVLFKTFLKGLYAR